MRQKQEKKSMLCLSKVLLIPCESCSETSSLASFVFLGLSLFADFLSASRTFLFTRCVFLSFTCTKLCSGEIHLYILTAGLRVQMELHNLTHALTHTDTQQSNLPQYTAEKQSLSCCYSASRPLPPVLC